MNKVHNLLPGKIEATFDEPKLFEVVKCTSESHVLQFIETELARLSSLVSVGGNLTATMIQFIAKELLDMYPNETLADFKICFKNAAMGKYNRYGEDKDIFRLDSIVVGRWMQQYLDEKYHVLETKLASEKQEYWNQTFKPTATDEISGKYINQLLEILKPEKKVRSITQDEIAKEGRERMKSGTGYKVSQDEIEVYEREYQERIRKCMVLTLRERHPDWNEEQIQQRIEEIQSKQ